MVNKVDRPAARVDWVVDQTFELFLDLGATDEQCGEGGSHRGWCIALKSRTVKSSCRPSCEAFWRPACTQPHQPPSELPLTPSPPPPRFSRLPCGVRQRHCGHRGSLPRGAGRRPGAAVRPDCAGGGAAHGAGAHSSAPHVGYVGIADWVQTQKSDGHICRRMLAKAAAACSLPSPQMEAPLQMLVTNLDYDEHKGRIASGRVQAGTLRKGDSVVFTKPGGYLGAGRAGARAAGWRAAAAMAGLAAATAGFPHREAPLLLAWLQASCPPAWLRATLRRRRQAADGARGGAVCVRQLCAHAG